MFSIERLNALLKQTGIKKKFIADKIGREPAIFYDWAKGKSKPSEDLLSAVSELLNTSPEYLLGITDTPTTNEPPALSESQKRRLELHNLIDNIPDKKLTQFNTLIKAAIDVMK